MAAGLGGGGGRDAGGSGLVGQLVYERAPHHFALRGLGLADLPYAQEGLAEAGLLYGRFGGGGIAHAAMAAGLSAVHLERCDDNRNGCTTVGLPLTAEVVLTPLDVIGIGFQVFANINPKSPYAGLFVLVPIGWMP